MSVYQNTSTVVINSTAPPPSGYCRRFQHEDKFYKINFAATLVTVVLNVFCCPPIILMNSLVIVAVKTRHSLQTMSNILLASLAGADLLVGTITLPASIATEIFLIAGGSLTTYCNFTEKIASSFRFLSVLTSVFHLGVISVERYIALKYSLRYDTIVTIFRLKIAISITWCLSLLYTLFRKLIVSSLHNAVLQFLVITCLLIIVYCHGTVYMITRRHERQIRTEQISSGEDTERFMKEKKAWKTTAIILGILPLCLLPGVCYSFGLMFSWDRRLLNILRPLVVFFLIFSSLCNPTVYCFRMKSMRQAMIALLRRSNDHN